MRGITLSESRTIKSIVTRLEGISSPVLRMQAILQFSQSVDMLTLGDTSGQRETELVALVDDLQNELAEKQ